jgi:predicted nucleic acid-binding protein
LAPSEGVLVDSNVLIDVVTEDPRWYEWSAEHLARLADRARLVINPIVYAEVSVTYATIEDLENAIELFRFHREAIPFEAAFLAGKAFARYRRRGGARTSPLADFFIGAHAAFAGLTLLTRDLRRYLESYPRLSVIAPR